MKKIKFQKGLAALIAIIMLMSTLTVITGGFPVENINISNAFIKDEQDSDVRENTLVGTGIGEDFTERLRADGFSNNEITEARMLVERLLSHLKEITDESSNDSAFQKEESIGEKNEDELIVYKELLGKIDTKTAIYLILKLKKDFGSMESVLNEYIYALQVEVNLEVYLINKEEYEKQKSEKSAGMNPNKILTMEKIEAKMLEVIQKRNEKNKDTFEKRLDSVAGITANQDGKSEDELPQSPLPEIKNLKPQNPGSDVMKEINDIRDKALNQD